MRRLIPVGTLVLVESNLHGDFIGYVYQAEVDKQGSNQYYIDCRSEERRAEHPQMFLDPDLSTFEDWHLVWDDAYTGTSITY